MLTGLVLEGGSMRGMFTAGILDFWMENNVHGFTAAIGVSAGACFGCNFKSHQIGRAIRYNKKYCNDPRYHSLRSLITTGDLYNENFCYHRIPFELDPFDMQTYAEDPMEFWAAATDVSTGLPVYRCLEKMDEHDLQFVRASASIPIVSHPVEFEGQHFVDGGVADSIPVKWMLEARKTDRAVVILTRPAGYRKKPLGHDRLFRAALKKYPALADQLLLRHEHYNACLDYIAAQEKAGRVLALCPPDALPVSAVEKHPENLQKAYETGRRVAEETIEKVSSFIK